MARRGRRREKGRKPFRSSVVRVKRTLGPIRATVPRTDKGAPGGEAQGVSAKIHAREFGKFAPDLREGRPISIEVGTLRDCTPNVTRVMMIQSDPHGDMRRLCESTARLPFGRS